MSKLIISQMDDLELAGYMKQAEDVLRFPGVDTLVAIDPELELLVDIKTLYYRLREETALRESLQLRKLYVEGGLDKIQFDELTRPEMDLAYPELGKFLDALEKEEAAKEGNKPPPFH